MKSRDDFAGALKARFDMRHGVQIAQAKQVLQSAGSESAESIKFSWLVKIPDTILKTG
jgi:hypothetical protein